MFSLLPLTALDAVCAALTSARTSLKAQLDLIGAVEDRLRTDAANGTRCERAALAPLASLLADIRVQSDAATSELRHRAASLRRRCSVPLLPLELVALVLAWIHPRQLLPLRRISRACDELLLSASFAKRNLDRTLRVLPESQQFYMVVTHPLANLYVHGPASYRSALSGSVLASVETIFYPGKHLQHGTTLQGIETLHHLTKLKLYHIRLRGFPLATLQLSALKELSLSNSSIQDVIPPTIAQLQNLETLGLTQCKLHGTLPRELGQLKNLKKLFLGRNRLTGPIPPDICNLSRLENLALHRNLLTGSLPSDLGRLQSLLHFFAADNSFVGEIPGSLGRLARLETLDLQQCRFSGRVPASLGNLLRLESLFLNGNELEGELAEEVEAFVPFVLEEWDFRGNHGLRGSEGFAWFGANGQIGVEPEIDEESDYDVDLN
ncbi:hypothetical protein BC830DRAFT_128293 [Chytriomyces sp. MP71]|nr:hypothetical protein BC830DRAFT_128293 [Chytriomyces sp. MP71]